MKKVVLFSAFALSFVVTTSSCSKNKRHDCHYDKAGLEIEMGEYCGDDLKQLEALGTFTDSTGTYTVHCEEH
jgi:hypothetical protein